MASLTKTAQILSDVDTKELMSELARRLECAIKPEKHVILVGESVWSSGSAIGYAGWLAPHADAAAACGMLHAL